MELVGRGYILSGSHNNHISSINDSIPFTINIFEEIDNQNYSNVLELTEYYYSDKKYRNYKDSDYCVRIGPLIMPTCNVDVLCYVIHKRKEELANAMIDLIPDHHLLKYINVIQDRNYAIKECSYLTLAAYRGLESTVIKLLSKKFKYSKNEMTKCLKASSNFPNIFIMINNIIGDIKQICPFVDADGIRCRTNLPFGLSIMKYKRDPIYGFDSELLNVGYTINRAKIGSNCLFVLYGFMSDKWSNLF